MFRREGMAVSIADTVTRFAYPSARDDGEEAEGFFDHCGRVRKLVE